MNTTTLKSYMWLLNLTLPLLLACTDPTNSVDPAAEEIPEYTFRVVNTYLHDAMAFTQGLVVEDSVFYEGTGGNQFYRGSGGNRESTLRRVKVETGEVLQIHRLSSILFGEGITIFNNRIYQLTWKSNSGIVYDKDTFEDLRSFSYPTEGWGLTHDGEHFIMSDGTAILYFRDAITFEETGRRAVLANGVPVDNLNELEYVNGEVYANVWQTDRIARINPVNGRVIGWIDLTGLLDATETQDPDAVLNGIAYDAANDRLFVTGKLWPKIYEIEVVSK